MTLNGSCLTGLVEKGATFFEYYPVCLIRHAFSRCENSYVAIRLTACLALFRHCVRALSTEASSSLPASRRGVGKVSWKYLLSGILIVIAFVSGLLIGPSINPPGPTLLGCGSQTGYPFCPLHFVDVMGRANATGGTPNSIWFYSTPLWGIVQLPMVAHVACGSSNGPYVCIYELFLWADKELQSDLTVNGQLHRKGETYSMSYNATMGYLDKANTQMYCSATPSPFMPTAPTSGSAVIQNFFC